MDDYNLTGIFYITVAAVGIVLNTLAIWGIFALGKLKKNYGSMYILYLQPLATDIIFLLTFGLYIAPTAMIHNSYFPEPIREYAQYILDSSQSYCFANNSLSHVSLAVNRFFVTVLLQMNFFTRRRTIFIAILQHFVALCICVSAQFLLPCCRLEIDYWHFNLRTVFIPDVPNYSLNYIRLPFRISCSVIPFVIYCVILLTTLSIRRNLKLQSNQLNQRRKQELRFAIQFATISVLYTLSWGVFTILPWFSLSASKGLVDGASILFALLNATTNAVAFLLNDLKKLRAYCSNGVTHVTISRHHSSHSGHAS